PHTVVAYVFRPGDHDEIVTSMGTGRTVLIEPGLYDVRAVMTVAARERMVRWHQVEIAEGRHHRLDVSFRRGALRVAALNAGRPLAGETVRLTAYRAEDDQEEPLQSGRASVPMALPVGRYDVKATFSGSSDQPSRWLRDVEIAEDVTLDRAVEFRSGTINVTATLGDGDALSAFDVYVYYYRPGDHAQAVAYTPLGEAATLEAGHYDVRAHFFRSHDQPNVWVRNQELPAGRTVRIRLSFLSGTLLIRARDAQGAEFLGDNVFVDVFAANQRVKPIASARGSETMILGEGTYDVRVVDTRQASRETWLEGLTVVPGRLTEESVTLQD
ncbi:MAG: hypothetical protein CMJ18_10835, partial [Phycisphaeraceae bacterium]|nr:hypothetical protein [Phycisphaeraceae bacterium]